MCSHLPWGSTTWEIWEEWLLVKTEAKKLVGTSVFSMLVVTSSPVIFTKGSTFSLIFLSGQRTLHPLSNSPQTVPYLSWSHPYTSGQHSQILPIIYVPGSTACTFPSYALVWPVSSYWAVMVSCLPTHWNQEILCFKKNILKELTALFSSLIPQGIFLFALQ